MIGTCNVQPLVEGRDCWWRNVSKTLDDALICTAQVFDEKKAGSD